MSWDPRATHVTLTGTANLRDLGGTPTADGAVVAPGVLYRAEALVEPGTVTHGAIHDPAASADYAALGVRTVIDLRGRGETGRAPSAWPTATGADHVALPIDEGAEGDTNFLQEIRDGRRTRFTVDDLAAFYAQVLRRRADVLAGALRVIADPDRRPVLVHCAAGKDRTGLVVALVLEALGCTRDVVVAEYALTGVLRPNRVADYTEVLGDAPVDLADVAVLFDAPPAAMATALRGLDDEYGSVAAYLREVLGLTDHDLAALRANLLAASAAAS